MIPCNMTKMTVNARFDPSDRALVLQVAVVCVYEHTCVHVGLSLQPRWNVVKWQSCEEAMWLFGAEKKRFASEG